MLYQQMKQPANNCRQGLAEWTGTVNLRVLWGLGCFGRRLLCEYY